VGLLWGTYLIQVLAHFQATFGNKVQAREICMIGMLFEALAAA
jgi:hypothetical protein